MVAGSHMYLNNSLVRAASQVKFKIQLGDVPALPKRVPRGPSISGVQEGGFLAAFDLDVHGAL